jgi:glycine betaine/proline transport system substrate-binding protein
MNWASAGVAAYVDKIILESGYGCKVTVVTGDTMPTFASMNEKGQPDMAPEFWVNAVRTALDEAIAEGRLIQAAPLLSDGGVEGWWIPKFIADANPDIKSVQDALNHPELFPAPEDPSKAAVTNCPSGWNCQVSTSNLYRALGAKEKGFELIDTGSAAGLDGSIANAFENKKGWLGYYWAPTAILGKYEMVKLSFGVEHDKESWDACTAVPDCADPKVNSYPISDVYTVVTKGFADKAGVAMDYVKTRKWDNATVGKVLAWMEENQGTNEDGAKHFLETYPDMWTTWVAPEVSEKVKAAL